MRALAASILLFLCNAVSGAETDVAQARALVDAWLRAQNTASFADYAALYAPTFTGVRRVGARRVELDHDAWLKDRKRMFARAITVGARDLVTTTGSSGIEVRFTQTFATGSFSDRGPKKLLLEHGPGGLRIVREEMLASAAERPPVLSSLPVEKFSFVIDGALVVEPLITPATSKAVHTLKSVRHEKELSTELRGRIDPKRIPSLLALEGRRYRVYGLHDERCVARVGVHFTARAVTQRDVPKDETLPATMDEFERSEYAYVPLRVLAELIPESGDCKGGTWARDADASAPPSLWTTDSVSEKVALAALRLLPEYASIERTYRSVRGEVASEREMKTAPAQWEDLPDAIQTASFHAGATTSVWIHIDGGRECGSAFGGTLEAIFELSGTTGAPTVNLRYVGRLNSYDVVHPVALVDLDGDGVPELIVDGGESMGTWIDGAIMKKAGERYQVIPVMTSPRDWCHC